MTISTTPAPARTRPAETPASNRSISPTTIRILGAATAVGAAAWSAGIFVWGADPDSSVKVWGISSLLFQLGVLALLHVQFRTRATGTGKLARGLMVGEHALLFLAMASTIQEFFVPQLAGSTVAAVLDAFWPLSMLGMFGIGIRIAIAGRWSGAARFWPMVAESWAVVSVPALALLGPDHSRFVASGHLLVGYLALGVIVAVRPGLTERR